MRPTLPCLAALVLGLAACEDPAGPPADSTSTDAAGGGDATLDEDIDASVGDDGATGEDATRPHTPYALSFGGWTMQPAQETTRCIVKRLDNAEPILVHRITTSLSKGSHHLIVYRSAATAERPEPFPCAPFTETISGGTVPLVISQLREDAVELPPGVAYELEAHQMIRLEAHYLDYFAEPITADVTVTFETLPASEAVDRADIIFYGTLGIHIPKDQRVTLPWVWYGVPSGLHIFAMTGHTHALGTNVEVERTTGAQTAGEALYPPAGATFDWAEAPVARFDPPLELDAAEGFRFRCTWLNTSGHDVGFGESATSEMCFFWAYYYPSQGPLIRF